MTFLKESKLRWTDPAASVRLVLFQKKKKSLTTSALKKTTNCWLTELCIRHSDLSEISDTRGGLQHLQRTRAWRETQSAERCVVWLPSDRWLWDLCVYLCVCEKAHLCLCMSSFLVCFLIIFTGCTLFWGWKVSFCCANNNAFFSHTVVKEVLSTTFEFLMCCIA